MRRGRPDPEKTVRRANVRAFRPGAESVERRILLTIYTVDTTADSGAGSLRDAITKANTTPGADEIRFDIPADVNNPNYDRVFQVWAIRPTTELPHITDTLEIDGYSQRVEAPVLTNATQTISAVGNPAGSYTLSLGAQTTGPIPVNAPPQAVQAALEALSNIGQGNVAVTGGPLPGQALSVTFQRGLGMRPVPLLVSDNSNITVLAGAAGGLPTGTTETIDATPNTIGLAVGNPSQASNAHIRIILDGSQTSGATGLTIAASHSQVFGLAIDRFETGIRIIGAGNIGNMIQGNSIGLYVLYPDPNLLLSRQSFLAGMGNAGEGIRIETANNMVGGFLPAARNTIAGNGAQGIHITPGADGNQVFGNLIGIATQDATLYYQGVGNGAEGVLVESSSNLIGEPVVGATNVISENHLQGVRIVAPVGSAATENRVQSNYIGSDPGGTLILGKQKTGNYRDGVLVENAPKNLIGGPTKEARNVIIGNGWGDDPNLDRPINSPPTSRDNDGWDGVRIIGRSATNNDVLGNYIGVDVAGTLVIPNAGDGVFIAAPDNIVGGTNDGERNVISGNWRGVRVTTSNQFNSSGTGNQILGNYIGTDFKGEADLGNSVEGVRIDDVTGNTVGGTAEGSRNLISGNNVGVGIYSVYGVATGNLVQGNFIGTDVTGTRAIPNSQEGVLISASPSNTIGGTAAGAGNLISGNHWGLTITEPTATGNLVQGNLIGTDATGTQRLGNEVDGVRIINDASRNTIGGLATGAGNVIAFNRSNGVTVGLVPTDASAVGNAILTNRIFSNGRLGIDLGNDGVTPNDPGDADSGPNNLQNAPVLTSVATSIAFTLVGGTLSSTPNTTFLIQFFAGSATSGQAERFLGQTVVRTDGAGNASFTANVPGTVPAGQFVTATATDSAGNTSEFSPGISEALGTVQFQMAGYSVSEGAGMATLVVTRVGGSGGLFTVNYASADGTATAGQDYTPVSGTLTFQPGESTKVILVPIIDDALPEANETFTVTLSQPTGAAKLGMPASATVTILDNDQPGTLRFSSSLYVVNEAQMGVVLTVVRDSGGGLVTVNFATADGTAKAGSDYLAEAGTLTFLPGQTSATILVPIVDDQVIEGIETFNVVLASPTGGAMLGEPSVATVAILDDTIDRVGPRIIAVQALPARRFVPGIVLTFNELLNAASAQDLANYGYSVQVAGRDRRLGTADDVLVGLRSANYNAINRTVTLVPASVIHRNTPILVQVDQATGVPGGGQGITDLAGNLLDGDNNGVPGGGFSAVVIGGGPGTPLGSAGRPARRSGHVVRSREATPPARLGAWPGRAIAGRPLRRGGGTPGGSHRA